jgi:hypothetical protein
MPQLIHANHLIVCRHKRTLNPLTHLFPLDIINFKIDCGKLIKFFKLNMHALKIISQIVVI